MQYEAVDTEVKLCRGPELLGRGSCVFKAAGCSKGVDNNRAWQAAGLHRVVTGQMGRTVTGEEERCSISREACIGPVFKTIIFGLLHPNKQTNKQTKHSLRVHLEGVLTGLMAGGRVPSWGACRQLQGSRSLAESSGPAPVSNTYTELSWHATSSLTRPPTIPYRTLHRQPSVHVALEEGKYPEKHPKSTLGLTHQCWSRMGVDANTGSHWSVQISSVACVPRTCRNFVDTSLMRTITNRRFSSRDGKLGKGLHFSHG